MAIAGEADQGRALERPTRTRRRRAMSDWSERRVALLFVLPALALVALFRIFPLVWGFVLSLTDSNGLSQGNFVGLDNYRAIAADPTFRDSIENTLVLIATLPAWILLPLLLAILIHQGVPGGNLFRAVYFF